MCSFSAQLSWSLDGEGAFWITISGIANGESWTARDSCLVLAIGICGGDWSVTIDTRLELDLNVNKGIAPWPNLLRTLMKFRDASRVLVTAIPFSSSSSNSCMLRSWDLLTPRRCVVNEGTSRSIRGRLPSSTLNFNASGQSFRSSFLKE